MISDLISDDKGVSPVIGIILMVAITVVLAALIASFVLGMGDSANEPTPQAAFEFDFEQNETYNATNIPDGGPGKNIIDPDNVYYGDQLSIIHSSGDPINAENIRVEIEGAGVKYINQTGALQDFGGGEYHSEYTFDEMESGDEITAGTEVTIVNNYGDYTAHSPGDPYHPGEMLRTATVTVLYENEDQSTVLNEWEGPAA